MSFVICIFDIYRAALFIYSKLHDLYELALRQATPFHRTLLASLKEFGSYPRCLNAAATKAATDERNKEAALALKVAKAFPRLDPASIEYIETLKKLPRPPDQQNMSSGSAAPAASSSGAPASRGRKRKSSGHVPGSQARGKRMQLP